MNSVSLPDDCAKQWDILLLLLSSEEKKIDRTNDSEVDTMNYFIHNEGVRLVTFIVGKIVIKVKQGNL